MEGFEVLVAGLAIFFGFHLLVGIYETRTAMINMLGANMHRMLHSVGAVAGLSLIVLGFMDRPMVPVYEVESWGQPLAIIVMPLAIIYLVGSGFPDMKRITRHPMLWGIALWGFAHLSANGDKASVMLFGSFMIYGFVAMFLGDRKARMGDEDKWRETVQTTSIFPFIAIVEKRAVEQRVGVAKPLIIGLVIYAILLQTHQYFTGISILPI